MNKQIKTIGLVIILVIVSYNIYDFMKAKNEMKDSEVKTCMTKFIQNTGVSESIARNYCDCALESLRSKYNKDSKLSERQIRENESDVLQGCYDQAIASESK